MSALTYDTEHATRGVERLIERYRRPRTSALLESWLAEVQAVEDALWQLLVDRSLETAEGYQLDVLGRIVGEPRRGRDDATYRVWIEARNLVHRSSGTTTQMLAIVRKLLPTIGLELEEYYPAAFVFRFGPGLDLDAGYQVAYMLRLAKPAGVLFEMTWPIDGSGGIFAFSPDDVPVPSSPIGFDAGVWAVVADGSFIPSEPPAPEVPSGSIVLEGVPVTLGGAYITIAFARRSG